MSDNPAAATPVGPGRIIALLAAGSFVSAASLRAADPLLPQFAQEFGVTPGDASIVVTSFALAYGISQILYGPLGDRFGKITVIAVGMVAAALGIVGSAFTHDLTMLSLMRLFSGAGAAAVVPLAMAYIGDVVPYGQRQAMLARFLSGFILGTAAGQAAGGWFADHIGWRGLFVLLGLLFLIVDILLWREIASPRLVQLRAPPASLPSLLLRYLRLFRLRSAQIVLATVLAEGFLFYGSFAFIGAYLRFDFDLDLTRIGLALACFGMGGLCYAALVKIIVGSLGERRMAIVGGLLLAAACLACALAGVWWIMPFATASLGVGYYLLHNTLQTRGTQMAPDDRGIAMSLFASLLYMGQASGVAVAGSLIDRIGYRPVFAGAGILLLLLALAFATTLGRRSDEQAAS